MINAKFKRTKYVSVTGFLVLLSGCMPPAVWTKPGVTTEQINAARAKCYQTASDAAGVNQDRRTSLYEDCMERGGYVKVPQWQAR